MSTPTSRTLKLLRDEGKLAEVVEKWNSFTMTRKDIFGFLDILAIDPVNKTTTGIQCTSTGNVKARIKKISVECNKYARAWLMAGNLIEVIGWSKKGKAGKRKTWQVMRVTLTLDNIPEITENTE